MSGNPRVFWTGVALGGAVLGFGLFGLFADAGPGVTDVKPVRWLVWVVGALLVHDLVVVPIVLLAGRGLRRIPSGRVRTVGQAGLSLTAMLTLLTYPLLRGIGPATQPGNASIQPQSYPVGLLIALAVVWVGAATISAMAVAVSRRR